MTFRVMRTYSHTDQRCLWSVESRPFSGRKEAEDWKSFLELEWKELHPKRPTNFFVIMILGVDEDGGVST